MIRKLAVFLALLTAFAAPALADANIRVVVPVRDIARGEVLAGSDLSFGTFNGTALMNGTFLPRVAVPAQPGPAPSAQAAASSADRVP